MKKMKKIASFILAVSLLVTLGACGEKNEKNAPSKTESTKTASAASLEQIKKSGKIVMVTNADFEPFEFMQDNKVSGIDPDIAKHIADKLGVKLEIKNVAFDSVMTELQTGKADFAAAGMTITPKRLKNADFCKEYFEAKQAIIVKKDNESIKGPKDLKGKTVGVQTGTTGDMYVTDSDHKNKVDVKEVKRYNTPMDAVSDMVAGRIDAVVIDEFPADKLVAKNPKKVKKLETHLTSEKYAFAVKKGDTELKDFINGVFDEMEKNGEIKKIIAKYEPDSVK